MEAADQEYSRFTSYELPIARVVYFNSKLSFQTQRRIEEAVQAVASHGECHSSTETMETMTTDKLEVMDEGQTITDAGHRSHGNSHQLLTECDPHQGTEDESVNYVEYYKEFCLDWLGVPAQRIEALEIVYHKVYTGVFWIDEFTAREESRLRRMAIQCFNCGDDHHLKDCPQPRNRSRISAQRSVFKASLPTLGADTRYHTLTLADCRFSKFTPGKISEKLAKALGLSSSTEPPPYVVRMKQLGYPPGYKLAEESNSLALFDSVCADSASDEVTSDGCAEEITYPGFNAPDVIEPDLPTEMKATLTDLEELGTLSEYEFEEEEGENGVGFGLKKLLQQERPEETKENSFSLDFPPGLVHLDEDNEAVSSGKWTAIKTLIHKRTK